MVVDTSALVAILQGEAEADAFRRELSVRRKTTISVVTAFEAFAVVSPRWGAEGTRRLDALIENADIAHVAVDQRQMQLAKEAYGRFGRGSGHPARLNFGDCFSYALARSLDAPLLYKGDDFSRTDIRSAIAT
jgi:ribonuclease VapC